MRRWKLNRRRGNNVKGNDNYRYDKPKSRLLPYETNERIGHTHVGTIISHPCTPSG